MKIAFLVLDASFGGHARSAATIGRALGGSGHEILFFCPSESAVTRNPQAGLAIHKLPSHWRNPIYDAKQFKHIEKILKASGVGMIHTFDLHSHVVGYFLSRKLKIPMVSTICGGTVKHRYPYTRPMIVFSQELKMTMVERFGFLAEDIIVQPARMEINPPSKVNDETIREHLGLAAPQRLIGMVARVSLTLEPAINCALASMNALASRRQDFIFALVGAVEDAGAAERIRSKIEAINQSVGRTVVLWDATLSGQALAFLNGSEIVLGYGRVCFEGMICGKPTMLVGPKGYSATISPSAPMERLAHFNFSARDNARSTEESVRDLTNDLSRLLDDEVYRHECAVFGNEWVRLHLDVRHAITAYTEIYERLRRHGQCKRDPFWRALGGYGILFGGQVKNVLHGMKRNRRLADGQS